MKKSRGRQTERENENLREVSKFQAQALPYATVFYLSV